MYSYMQQNFGNRQKFVFEDNSITFGDASLWQSLSSEQKSAIRQVTERDRTGFFLSGGIVIIRNRITSVVEAPTINSDSSQWWWLMLI
jgi:hypothetical protein